MTGIAAIHAQGPRIAERLGLMASSLKTRPHDAFSDWIDGDTGIAACALHATRESSDGELPWLNEDRTIALALDGYLANYDELRRDLRERGDRLRNASDAELVLRAYERWGEQCTAWLDGEYAVVIVDRRKRTVFCFRDHQGLRPLYYRLGNNELVVASDIATVLAGSEQVPEPNANFLAQIAAATIVTPEETAWQGILRVPAASQMVFREGAIRTSRYYTLPTEVTRLDTSADDCTAEYLETVRDAVRRASRSHRPLACEVSGGLDSSAMFGLAHELEAEGLLLAPSLRGFALRGKPGTQADEIAFARDVARHLDRDLAEADLFEPPLEWFAEQASAERDIATYPNGAQSITLEQRMVETGARVVINGNGGDQWLDGSRGYVEQNLRALQLGRLLRNGREHGSAVGYGAAIPEVLRRAILASLPIGLRDSLRRVREAARTDRGADLACLNAARAAHIDRLMLERHTSAPTEPAARDKLAVFDSAWTRFASDMMARQRSRSGIEARSPLLSRQFIEFCCSLPEDMKLRGAETRWIHRRAMRGILPRSVVERTSKAEFPGVREIEAIARIFEQDMPAEMSGIVNLDEVRAFLKSQPERDDEVEMPFVVWGLFIVGQFVLDNSDPIGYCSAT